MQVDPQHQQPCVAEIIAIDAAVLVENLDAVGGAPFVVRGAIRLDPRRHDSAMPRGVGPEIDAGDPLDLLRDCDAFGNHVAVAEPKRFVVDVIAGAARRDRLAHRPGAGKHCPPGAWTGQKIGLE